MFKNIKVGDSIYILKNISGLVYYDAIVSTVVPEVSNQFELMRGVYSPVTITAKSKEDEEFKLDRLNAMLDYMEIPQNNGTIIISTSKDKINNYTKKLYDEAKMRLSKVDEYKKIIEDGEIILSTIALNPSDITEIRVNKIGSSIEQMNKMLVEMSGMMKNINKNPEEESEV